MQIIIIGAGISGLFAGKKLHEQGFEVKILEAKNRIGGRIFSKNFKENPLSELLPVEMGAEEVHGQKSDFFTLLQNEKIALKKSRQNQDFYLWEGREENNFEKMLFTEQELETENSDFKQLVKFYQKIFYTNGMPVNASVLDIAQEKNLSDNAKLYLDTWLSNAYGVSIADMNARALKEAEGLWDAGTQNFFLKENSLSQFLISYFADILPLVHFEKNIIQIDYTNPNKILLSSPQNEVWEADKVVISVPVSILKNKRINFVPDLPDYKYTALKNLQMERGLKVALQFQKPFWDKKTGSIYTTLGEYYPAPKTENVLMFLALHHKANHIVSLPKQERDNFILKDLNQAFGNTKPISLFKESIFQDWGAEPHIEGAYSFAQKDAKKTRQQLARPVDNRLFFIGEATDVYCPATMQGAMYSGLGLEIDMK